MFDQTTIASLMTAFNGSQNIEFHLIHKREGFGGGKCTTRMFKPVFYEGYVKETVENALIAKPVIPFDEIESIELKSA